MLLIKSSLLSLVIAFSALAMASEANISTKQETETYESNLDTLGWHLLSETTKNPWIGP